MSEQDERAANRECMCIADDDPLRVLAFWLNVADIDADEETDK